MGLASGIWIILLALGGFIMIVSYGEIAQCSAPNVPWGCWNPNYGYALAFYIGAAFTILGIAMLLGGTVLRQLEKLRDAGEDSGR